MLDLNESEEHDGQVREQETVDAATAIRAGTIQQVNRDAVDEQKAIWLQAPEGITVKGIPLRCLLCKNKLLVNSSTITASICWNKMACCLAFLY